MVLHEFVAAYILHVVGTLIQVIDSRYVDVHKIYMSMEGSSVTGAGVADSLRRQFMAQEDVLGGMIGELSARLDQLGRPDISKDSKNDIVLGVEYMVVRLRGRLLLEMSNIRRALSCDSGVVMTKLLRERIGVVEGYSSLLNQLRQDFDTIQRMRYNDGFRGR